MSSSPKQKNSLFFCAVALITAVSLTLLTGTPLVRAEESVSVDDLTKQIEQRKQSINSLEKKIDSYKKAITQKQTEGRTLQNQLAIVENQIARLGLDIDATNARIEQTNLEIQKLNIQITDQERLIENQRRRLSDYILLINQNDQVSYLQVLTTKPTFSDFFDQVQRAQEIHNRLKSALDTLKLYRQQLEIQKSNWEEKVRQEEEYKEQLLGQKNELGERKVAQGKLLEQTKLTSKQYQSSLAQLQLEQQQINADIVTFEKRIREELERKRKEGLLDDLGSSTLSWPISPSRGLTALFRDPDYPFRHIFEHPAIDIRTPMGTTIKAPANGYVAKVKFKGDTSYAYIMLIHSDGISTVYGHISKPLVSEEQVVTKGQAIALSGGLPRTPGAGSLSTGPHLHFEVRVDGIPADPLKFLPAR